MSDLSAPTPEPPPAGGAPAQGWIERVFITRRFFALFNVQVISALGDWVGCFAITSLATAQPVADAGLRIEALRDDKYVTLVEGRTDAAGLFVWRLDKREPGEIKRIVATKGLDTLALAMDDAGSEYARENWTTPEDEWLGWTTNPDEERAQAARTLCHVFTERPIYRPEEPVHIKGFVRSYLGGRLSYPTKGGALIAINNALFSSGADFLNVLEAACADGYLSIESLIPVPQDLIGYASTAPLWPADPTPFNHPTKMAVLRVSRKTIDEGRMPKDEG